MYQECITRIDGRTVDDSEDLDLVMVMYNLLEYSSKYFDRAGSLWFYSKDEGTDFNSYIENTDAFKCFRRHSCTTSIKSS